MKRLAAIFIGAAYARSLSYCGSGHGVDECLDVGVFLGDYRRNFPASTTISITNSGARSGFQQAILDFGTVSGSGKLISSVMCFSITRNGGNAYDIYDDVIDLVSFDLHH